MLPVSVLRSIGVGNSPDHRFQMEVLCNQSALTAKAAFSKAMASAPSATVAVLSTTLLMTFPETTRNVHGVTGRASAQRAMGRV